MKDLLKFKELMIYSKDGKVVFKNLGYLTLLQISGYIFPLITVPYLARVIGAEGFGKIAFASAIMVWIQTISDWGFNFTATRDVAQNKNDKDRTSRIFSNVLWARCLLAVVAGLLLLCAIALIPYFRENAAIIIITFLQVPGLILFPDWFFQAIEKMKYTTYFSLLVKLLFTIAVFIFIKEKDDYIFQPLLITLGYLFCGIGALFLIFKKWGYTLYKPKWKDILNTIKGSYDVFINNIMPNFYNSFSVLLLGFWGGSTANGFYDGGSKFPTMFYNFQSVLSRAFFPFLSRMPDKQSLYSKLNISISIIGSTILIVLAPFVVNALLGSEFKSSVVVMQILSVSLVFLAMSNSYGTNYLIIHHKEKPLRNLTFVSSLIGMCISIPLVYKFSYIGASITVLMCRAFLGIGAYIMAKRIMKSKKYNNQ